MRYLLKYFIKRLPREGFKSLSVPALALALIYLINVMGGVKARMEEEYEDTIQNYPIRIEVSNGDGTANDGLEIGETYLAQLTDPEALWSLYDFITDVELKRTLDIMGAEAPLVNLELLTVGWHEHIKYVATDYNDDVSWYFGINMVPDEVSEAYPDPDIYFEPYEGIPEDEMMFYKFLQDENGYWHTVEGYEYIFVSEDVLEYVKDGLLRFDVIRRMGPNTRLYTYIFAVSGVVKGPVSGKIFGSSNLSFVIKRAMGETRFRNTICLLPDESTMTVGDTFQVSIMVDTPVAGTLIGVSSINSEDMLKPENGVDIAFYEGYDEKILLTDENVALVSEDVIAWAEAGLLTIPVRSRGNVINVPEAQLKIIGTISGAGEALVVAPFLTVSRLGVESDESRPFTERMSATLLDNRELVGFKQAATRTFKESGIFFNARVFSMTIYDSEFYGITEALMQTIYFIDIATPFVYLIAVGVGFVASFLLTRRRKGEFAMMRSVGVGKTGIFFGALFEQTMLCLIGVALGCLIFTLTWEYMFIERPLIFLGCYMLGAAISAARAAGTDVLRLLREKE